MRKKAFAAWSIPALSILFLLPSAAIPLPAQDAVEKKVLSVEDYARWRSIGSAGISDDGNWITYAYRVREKDDILFVENVGGDKEYEIPRATDPKFSDDSSWVAYTLNLPQKEIKKLTREKKPIPKKAELMNLATGSKYTVENVSSFTFSKGSKFLAVKKAKADPKAKHNGSDLLLRNLESGLNTLIGGVSEFSFNKAGSMLAYLIDVEDKSGNGIYWTDLERFITKPLDTQNAIYERMTWDEEGSVLAVLRGTKEKTKKHRENSLVAFTDLGRDEVSKHEYVPSKSFDFPKGMVISEKGTLSWSSDHSKVFLGVKEQEEDPEKKEDADPVANVDIFHWKDERLQSVQIRQAERDRNFTYRSVFNLKTKRFIKLADEKMRTVQITRDGNWGIGQDRKPYISDWQPTRADYYRIDTNSGDRALMFEAQARTLGLSPDSAHFLYWKEGHIWAYKIPSGETINLTKDTPASFVNREYDRFGEKPPYGLAGWSKDGEAVLLYGKYDLWRQPLTGTAGTNLTGGFGDENEIRLRYIKLDPEEKFIDLSRPMLLSGFGQWTKKAGFFELNRGSLSQLIFEDKRFGTPRKAKNADKLMLTIETFADFPNYFVSDGRFSYPQRVTDANPWQNEYKWGRRILFEFKNSQGVRLQGTLAVPDDHQEGQRLPMLVNFYEKNSQNLHRYYRPDYASRPQFAGFVSNGYLVMQPDIHFNLRTSHSDMLECVEAAVKRVIEMGYADPDRIGLHGHSYSGGGSCYIATRSKMFAAIAAGAAPINLVSEFNQLFKGSGRNNHQYDIHGQGRYATNPYDDFDLYWDQSPIAHVKTMDTPLLYLHGVDDPTVEYLQGMEFYNALRFLKKNVIFLSYPGEAHGLRKIENQKDFTVRLHQFFDHHLKGTEAPDWIVSGVPFLKKKQ
jgi:hypothetical protein